MLVKVLILFFIILLIYQVFINPFINTSVIEGLDTYQPYDMNNPANALILAQQNAGNIQYIMQRFDSLQNLDKEVKDLSGNMVTLQEQVNGIVSAQAEYASQIGPAPDITGT
jgi:hypothetical protein